MISACNDREREPLCDIGVHTIICMLKPTAAARKGTSKAMCIALDTGAAPNLIKSLISSESRAKTACEIETPVAAPNT